MRQFVCILLSMAAMTASGQSLSLPQFFADGMVMQRGEKIPIWGKSKPGSSVTVTMNGKNATGTADADGAWNVRLPKMKAGGPYEMTVNDGQTTCIIQNILIGDVFLCSGQSNMELPVRRCMDIVGEQVRDYRNPQIRYLKVPHQYNYVSPNDDMRVLPWQDITPENCGNVSAICYFMARELQEKYGVPIGIINSSVGGTPVEAWTPQCSLKELEAYRHEFDNVKYHQPDWPDSIAKIENEAMNRWEREMTASDGIVQAWNKEGYDYSGWETVDVFSDWSKGKNGSYWFHTTVDLPSEAAGQPGLLRFGAIKDADSIFVNGQFVGNTTYQYPPRLYNVKEGIMKGGRNDIVVHLMSQNGRPSFNKAKLYQLEVGGSTYPIASQMEMAVGCVMPSKPSSTYFVAGFTGLYNAMIAPLRNFPFKGILWYQGESNMRNTQSYASLLSAMTDAWRSQFGKELPLVIVQLPGYMQHHDKPVDTGWTQIRHQQYLASKQIKNAGLAPTLDTGESADIHPQDKDVAGLRAALQMERLAYGENKVVADGPTPEKLTVKDGKAIIRFTKASGELAVKGSRLSDFSVKTADGFVPVEASVFDSHTIIVQLPFGVSHTTAVRYGWDDFPHPTLYNMQGIPAPQFEIEIED